MALFIFALLPMRLFAADSPQNDFYEAKIRPVFVEHCYSCHSSKAKAIKGGLRLDQREDVLKGGDSGPAVDLKIPRSSLLLRAVRPEESVEKMPPNGRKLSAAEVDDIEKWIADGAAMPTAKSTQTPNIGNTKSHWAFQPIPTIDPSQSIDEIVKKKASTIGLTLSSRADNATLLRRVSIDLTGLPPTWDEVRAFEADRNPLAYRNAVNRLLASSRYGERWGRHWLDVARFSDTKDGVLQYGEDRMRPFAYTYRDYVVRSFNEDLPYDRFVREQLAADQIEPKVDPKQLAAMGFLTLGRIFDNNIHDVLDDRIDTVSRGLLGLTVSCARCHDHKFDPIPTADYYSLYGIFSACDVPTELPALDPKQKGPAEFEKKYAEAINGIRTMRDQQHEFLLAVYRSQVGDYLVRIATTKPDPIETAQFFFSFAPNELRPPLVARWRQYLAIHSKPEHPVFGPWAELLAIPDDQFAERSTLVLSKLTFSNVNPLIAKELLAKPIKNKSDVASAYGRALKSVYDRAKVLPPEPLDATHRELWDLFQGPDGPAFFPKSLTQKFMSRAEADGFGSRVQLLDKLAVKEAAAPPRAMALVDLPDRKEPHIFIRGNPSRPGAAVPRQFLSAISTAHPAPFTHGSGRLDLANAIIAKENPLTARVLVNRVWMHHFGEPLVNTPSDFGLRTARPIQSELLDFLAASLIADNWSLKSLHRKIVLSDVYCQLSADRQNVREKDPENQYLCRANRRRLDWESMRDHLLFTSGRLDFAIGGRPTDVANDPLNRRRTVYGIVDRQSVPGVFRAFDFANPDQSVERRPQTTVPQQALFGMNSPFMMEQAKSLANRPEINQALDAKAKIRALYRISFARDASEKEIERGVQFVAMNSTDSKLDSWALFAQVLLLTNELAFVD